MTPLPTIPEFDYIVMNFIQEHFHTTFTDAVFPVLTYLGESGFIWIVLSIVFLVNPKTRKCGFICLGAMAMCFLFGEVFLKNVICRVRPCNQFPDIPLLIARPDSFSFPSGHSGSSFAAATAIFLCHKRIGICALILAFLIAFSRVFLFVHYPTDIIAGAILGVLFALLSYWFYQFWKRRETAKLKAKPRR